MTVEVVTFGCRLNAYESAVIRRQAAAAGIADTIVVNTCAVTAEAVRQSRQSIRKLKRAHPDTHIVVTGCAAQTEPETFAGMPEVALVLGNAEKLDPAIWRRQRAALPQAPFGSMAKEFAAEEKIVVNDIMAVKETATHLVDGFEGRARAFVQVQNGCDHRCTFCIIPYGRGNARSVPMGEVVGEVRRLCAGGYREVVLTGVDLTSYGSNLPGAPKLGTLVRQLLKHVPELERLRLSSIDSVEADRDLLDAFAEDARLMPHLHLSLQAGDDLVLKRMRRRHLRADAIAFCAQLRRLRPDVVFGGDIIAGFPTENEDMFARSLDLVDECALTHLHVFPFSPRPGTPAARMPQVAHDVVKARARRLRAKGEIALRAHLDAQVDTTRSVLIESSGLGYTEHFAQVRPAAPGAAVGAIVDLAIVGHDGRRLLAA
jgi:threonylcarbamoyladenosine tRNA methylthiotransferase MtaB